MPSRPASPRAADPAIRLRDAVPGDEDALAALEESVFGGESYQITRRQWRYLVRRPPGFLLVAEVLAEVPPFSAVSPAPGQPPGVAGALVLTGRRGGRSCRVYSLAVDPRRRRQGVARQLLAAAKTRARTAGFHELVLEVRAENEAALALYRGLGFERQARLPSYYGIGEDALRLRVDLDSPEGG